MPPFTLLGKYLNADDLDLIFFAYNRYRYERRPLLREEVCGIIGVWFEKDPPRLIDAKNVLNAFENPQDSLSEKHQRSTNRNVERLETDVKTCFSIYLKQDPEANARAEYLRGLSQRLVTPNWRTFPKWDNEQMWPYKLFPLYVISNHCKKADGSEMNEDNRLDAARRCFFDGVRSTPPIMKTLEHGKSKHAEDMAKSIKVDEGFFLRRTQEVLDQKMGVGAPRVDIPRKYRDNTVPSTTKALEAFTLESTAPSQAQAMARTGYPPVAPSPYQLPAPIQHQPLSTGSDQPTARGSHQASGPGSSQLTNPGTYRNPFTGFAQRRRRDPANPGSVLGSSSQSSGEDEDDEEEERGQEKKNERGKEKKKKKEKRQRSETPGAHSPRRRPFDPVRDLWYQRG